MKNRFSVLLFACALLLPCQGAPKTPAPPAKTPGVRPKTTSIKGTVTDAFTRAPIAGIGMKLWSKGTETTSASDLGFVKTDALGHFQIPVEGNTDYQLELPDTQAKGVDYSQFYVDVPRGQGTVTLDIARPRRGVVVGSVRDAKGNPATCELTFVQLTDGYNFRVPTNGMNADGTFRIPVDVNPFTGERARYQVTAADFWNPGKRGYYSTQIKTIEVSSHTKPGDETRLDIVLQPRAVVRGQITSGGRPVPGCRLQAGEQNENTHLETETSTDAQGRFEMYLSAPGKWKIQVNSPKESSTEFTEDGLMRNRFYGLADVTTSVECKTPGEARVFDITLPASASLSGKALGRTGKPLANAKVTLELPGDDVETQTKADGTYFLAGLPDSGPYWLELRPPGQNIGGKRQLIFLTSEKTTRVDFDLRPKAATPKKRTSTRAKKRTRSKRETKR